MKPITRMRVTIAVLVLVFVSGLDRCINYDPPWWIDLLNDAFVVFVGYQLLRNWDTYQAMRKDKSC